jgi:photosystem II stability/assembly factor-like uncharacterized protein
LNKNILLLFLIFLSSLFLISCTKTTKAEEPIHVHAVSFDPTLEDVYFIGTHQTLERYDGSQRITVGNPGNDFMSFTIAADGTFYSSGHSKKLGNVGIRISNDKGKTWKQIAYPGLDFHDMTTSYANSNLIYAWSTPPDKFLTLSKDAGISWNKIDSKLETDVFSLVADHQEENKLYAGTLFGLSFSEDYGETWSDLESLVNTTIVAIADDPNNEDIMYVSAHKKGILKTTDNGKTWKNINTGLHSVTSDTVLTLSVNPSDSTELVAVTKSNEFYKYYNGSWDIVDVFQKKRGD